MKSYAAEFAKVMGLDQVVEHGAVADMEIFEQLLEDIDEDKYCMIGGGAVVAHLSKKYRDISPDIDIITPPDQIALLVKSGKYKFGRGRFGIFVETPNMGIDIMLASSKLQKHAIKTATQVKLGGLNVKVASLQCVIAMKMVADREKDHDDIIRILSLKPQVYPNARKLVSQILPDSVEDLSNLFEMSKVMANFD